MMCRVSVEGMLQAMVRAGSLVESLEHVLGSAPDEINLRTTYTILMLTY